MNTTTSSTSSADLRAAILHDNKVAREQNMDQMLRQYITQAHLFRFGGLVNLLTTIASICEKIHEDGGSKEYMEAFDLINACAHECDKKYLD